MKNSDDDHSNSETETLINHSITIGEHLHKRIEKHIHLLKHLEDQSHTKQKWFISAFLEKIENDKDEDLPSSSKDRHLRFKLEKQLQQKIEKKIGLIKKFRKSYSKKQWFVEAIYEKLESEEEKARKLLLKLKDHSMP